MSYEHGFMKNVTVKKFARCCAQFRSVFHAPSRKFKILAIPNVLAHGKSYEHGFMKKCNGKNFERIDFRSIFRSPSRKFQILAIPDVLAHEKSYEHGFAQKRCTVINFA
ncbi:hypothetical protein B296_00033222 [Ensete ventricosum]|uniref:Uncharacterized protein n=1 Tax=Ensete ventricosum TaxID=4639 RepID=A0A426YVF2_ENSVE|nr:hypothetical protein B296_00033222 [Ensete ventricosum]